MSVHSWLSRKLWHYRVGVKLNKLGIDCRIDPRAEFVGCLGGIDLGDKVSIGRYSTIHCYDGESTLQIGEGTVLKQFATLMTYPGGKIQIGRNCSINPFCVLYGHGGLIVGDNVRMATHTVIIPAEHNFDNHQQLITQQGLTKKGVIIGSDVWFGAGVIVLDGCEIGKGSVIGAGSVVTKNIPPYSIAVGSPARVIRSR
jgi:acetyltransferase-like isoleucine patch superfamily enzyme